MGLCAANSAGHLSNHADIAPSHAGITFAISNTIVSFFFNTCSFNRLMRFMFELREEKYKI